MTGGIYEILNKVNGKRYIGKSKNTKSRWQQHRSSLRGGKHHNVHLQRAWDTYKEESFSFCVLFENDNNTVLNEKEKYFIKKFDSTNIDKGYNLTHGGDSFEVTDEARDKLRGLGSQLTYEDVRGIKLALYCLMDRKDICSQYNIKKNILEDIAQGANFTYVCEELNDEIKGLKKRLIDERDEQILKHYDSGKSIVEIVRKMGLTSSIVEKVVYKQRDVKTQDKYKKIFDEVHRLYYEDGIKKYQISKQLGISPSTVGRYLSGSNNPYKDPPTKKVTKEVLSEISTLYKMGISNKEIAKKLSISKTTVDFYINKIC